MSEKIKNYMGVAIIAGVLLLGYGAVSYGNAYSKSVNPSAFRSFSVSGDGKAVAIPDVATFTFSVITEGGKNLADLQTQNTNKVNKAIAFVKSSGVDAKDIKTQGYDVSPRYQQYNCYGTYSSGVPSIEPQPISPRPCPPAAIVGYTITQTVLVKVRDFSKAGTMLSGVVDAGANSVSSLQFTIDDPSKPQNEARVEAIGKAKAKAEAIARAGGFRLGKLLSIDENGGYPIYYGAYGKGGGGYDSTASAPAPAIEPGSQDVNVTVTLRYEIK